MTKQLADMAEHERPRERLAGHGPEVLRDAELLALVLRHGRAGSSALAMAEQLLDDHGGLVGLASVRMEDLARRPGMGPAKSASVVAACHLAARIRAEQERIPVARTAVEVADIAIPLLRHCRTERTVALVVDSAGQLRRALTLADEGALPTPTMLRDVLTAALHHGGAGLAVAVNHPDGDPAPHEADRAVARAVSTGAASVGLRFIAQVVVAGRLWEEVPVAGPRVPG